MAMIPDKPALSNRLSDLAERAGEAARRYRRGSIESIREYLTAGELLAEARGEWGAVLVRAGIADRTAQRMVQAWRVTRELGADAEAVHDAGGVRAFVEAALTDMQAALHAAADGLEAGEGSDVAGEKPDLGTGFSSGEPAPGAPVSGARAGPGAAPIGRRWRIFPRTLGPPRNAGGTRVGSAAIASTARRRSAIRGTCGAPPADPESRRRTSAGAKTPSSARCSASASARPHGTGAASG